MCSCAEEPKHSRGAESDVLQAAVRRSGSGIFRYILAWLIFVLSFLCSPYLYEKMRIIALWIVLSCSPVSVQERGSLRCMDRLRRQPLASV